MLNKIKFGYILLVAAMLVPVVGTNAWAEVDEFGVEIEEEFDEQQPEISDPEQASADAVAQYNVDGSLFQQITNLEQEKVLMQLEKERAQLDLELDRLAAEKIKLHMEIDTLSGRAEKQQAELEAAKAELEAQTARLEREKENLERQAAEPVPVKNVKAQKPVEEHDVDFSEKYKLVNVVGAGNQLQATLTDLTTGQNRRVKVGMELDGYQIKSISFDGVVLSDGDDTQTLNISSK